MFTISLQALSWLTFLLATILLGAWLRGNRNNQNAIRASKVLHVLFWIGVAPYGVLGVIYPGLTQYDQLLGIPPIPKTIVLKVLGSLCTLIGIYLFFVSNLYLWFSGKGGNAFFLTKTLVKGGIYRRTRNPMSLGLYLFSLGTSIVVRSTYLTFGTLFLVIPVHVFYLKYFEELELELRMGQPYLEYKWKIPFLLPIWSSPAYE